MTSTKQSSFYKGKIRTMPKKCNSANINTSRKGIFSNPKYQG